MIPNCCHHMPICLHIYVVYMSLFNFLDFIKLVWGLVILPCHIIVHGMNGWFKCLFQFCHLQPCCVFKRTFRKGKERDKFYPVSVLRINNGPAQMATYILLNELCVKPFSFSSFVPFEWIWSRQVNTPEQITPCGVI